MDVYNDVLNYLKELGLEDISKEEKIMLKNKLEGVNNSFQVKKELEMLYVLNRVLLSSYQKVSLENMYKINDNLDAQIAIKLFMEYQNIKSKCSDKFTCMENFKRAVEEIVFNQRRATKEVHRKAKVAMSKTVLLEDALYLTMTSKDKADKLINNCISRSSIFLSNCDKENLKILIDCLKNNFKLSDDELVMISSRCATFFASASASKINNLYVMLNEYKDFVKERLDPKKEKEALVLISRNFKDVLINSSLIAAADTDKVSETIKFLMGQELGKINHKVGKYANIKGEFTPSQLAKIYDKSITSLSMGADHIFDFVSNMTSVFKNVYKEELDLNGIINGRNFSGLSRLSKVDFVNEGKAEEILMLLKPFISYENMNNLLKNHVAFLSCSVNEVKEGLRNALVESTTPEDLKKNILSKIRNSFDTNAGEFVEVERKKGIYLGSLNKVEVNVLQEEEMSSVLSRLGTSNSEIERWKNNWNKESKEFRNLEIECELEEILEDVKLVEEMVPFSFASIEDFLKETDEVSELFEIALSRYEKISLMKLNKKLTNFSNEVKIKIDEVANKINQNYDRAIKWIHDQGEAVAKELEEHYKKELEYNENIDLLELIETELVAGGFDEDSPGLMKENIDSMESSFKMVNSISKAMKDKRKEIVEGIVELKKVFEVKFDEDGEILNASLSPIMSGYNADSLYNNLLMIFKEEGLLDGIDVHVKKDNGIKKLETYYELFEKEEIEIFDYLKKELEEFQRLKKDTLRVAISLLEDNGVDCSEVNDISKVKKAMEKLIEEKKKHYEDIKTIFKRRMDLIKELDEVDAEALSEKTDELVKKVQSFVEKMEETEKKKIVH